MSESQGNTRSALAELLALAEGGPLEACAARCLALYDADQRHLAVALHTIQTAVLPSLRSAGAPDLPRTIDLTAIEREISRPEAARSSV